MTRHAPLALFAALLAAPALLPSPAQAQNGSISNFTQNPEADRRKDTRKPSGLPGARQGAIVAPAERTPQEMSPNEALFDAVNRGDLAAARDALARGAQVEGRNMLGLTPLELSIDLGRNELTFLLLSMRGAPSANPPPRTAAAPARPAPPRAAERPAPAPRVAAPALAQAPAPRRQTTAEAAGTPVPQAGFLGFGAPIR